MMKNKIIHLNKLFLYSLCHVLFFWIEYYGAAGSSAKFCILKEFKTKIKYPSLILVFIFNPKRRNAEEPQMNILVARNRKSGNLEIGVPVLGNRLFCAWLLVHFYGDISQGLAVSAVRSSLC